MALGPFQAHQRIYGHIHGCPFCTGKGDQTGPINVSTVIFLRTIPKNCFRFHLRPSKYLRAFSLIPILDWEMGPVHQRIYGQIEGCLFWFKRMNHILSTVVFSEHMQIFFWLWLYIVWGESAPSPGLSRDNGIFNIMEWMGGRNHRHKIYTQCKDWKSWKNLKQRSMIWNIYQEVYLLCNREFVLDLSKLD